MESDILMQERISPAQRIFGTLRLPGDKSISHRYALLAAIAEGDTHIRNYSSPPVPANLLGRAARVRESREPAPHMGRASFVQTTGAR